MRVLIDTNVLIDLIAMREPWYTYALRIVDACDRNLLSGCIAAHSIPNIYYILRRELSSDARKEALKALCEIFAVEGLDKYKLIEALQDMLFHDFEDCLQMCCASSFNADYIITRNEDDFMNSRIPSIAPDVFCHNFLDAVK